jgi:hypothetical protein
VVAGASRIGGASVRVTVAAVAVLAVVAAPAGPALAQDAPHDAEKLIRHGIELRKSHDDQSAAAEFQKAYDLVHTPRAAGQLGLAEQALGRWEDAERHVREALQTSDDPWVTKNHATLAEALGMIQDHLGRVEVMGSPPGADVLVNGRSAGKLPLPEPVPVSAGQVDVELHAPGYQPAQRTLTLVAGQYQRVVLRLAREAPPPVAGAERNLVPPVETGPSPPQTEAGPTAREAPVEGPSTARTVIKWTSAGLAVAGLAAGVTFTIVRYENVLAFDTYPTCANSNGTAVVKGTMTPMPLCQSALDNYLLDTKLAIAGYVAAGVFGVTWLILQLTEPSAPPARAEQALGRPLCAPSLSGLGVACALRF